MNDESGYLNDLSGLKEYLEENGWFGLDEDNANEILELILIYKLKELNAIKNVLENLLF